jgi:two-component system, NtrC family, sensor kinase
MLVAHRQSIRLLQGVLVASAALPALLFAYASWESYSTARTTADRQIAQARDVLTEHGLKVFEAVERSIAEINEIVRGMNDAEIVANANDCMAGSSGSRMQAPRSSRSGSLTHRGGRS